MKTKAMQQMIVVVVVGQPLQRALGRDDDTSTSSLCLGVEVIVAYGHI